MPDDTTDATGAAGATTVEIDRHDVENLLSRFRVRLIDADGSETQHDITMSRNDWQRFGAGYRTPEALIEASVRYLLDREPKERILDSFGLGQIPRYFPSFARDIVPPA